MDGWMDGWTVRTLRVGDVNWTPSDAAKEQERNDIEAAEVKEEPKRRRHLTSTSTTSPRGAQLAHENPSKNPCNLRSLPTQESRESLLKLT